MKMLQTLNNLAGKISPNSGNQSPGSQTDNNANKVLHLNNNTHPYSKVNSSVISSNGSSEKNMNCADQPDPDFIKMFVGQIPRTMDENDLTKMFSEYGRVHQINVLRDKVTGQSKGCCFVTFYTRKAALEAQNALHNIKTLAGMHHPIQMKPADSENRNERKLFVGMLSKKCTENDVRMMFGPFGMIEECTVLRDTNGQSKGCAFVTYTSRQCALNAIKAMHHSHNMEGCSAPLVVKFADTQKEKDQRRMQQMQTELWNMAGLNGLNIAPHSYLTAVGQQLTGDSHSCLAPLQLLQQLQATNNGQTNPGVTQLLLHNTAGLQNLAALNGSTPSLADINPANLQGLATLANLSHAGVNPLSLQNVIDFSGVNPLNMQNLVTLAAITGGNNAVSPSALSGLTNSTAAAALLGKTTAAPVTGATTLNALTSSPLNGLATSALDAYQHFTNNSSHSEKQIEGPEGANLFIYHLPQDFNDADLATTFLPFGTVLSAKVFIDKNTKLSKCFGFVSYDNVLSAQVAIQNMDGYHIGPKKLKVQLKRQKSAAKPY